LVKGACPLPKQTPFSSIAGTSLTGVRTRSFALLKALKNQISFLQNSANAGHREITIMTLRFLSPCLRLKKLKFHFYKISQMVAIVIVVK